MGFKFNPFTGTLDIAGGGAGDLWSDPVDAHIIPDTHSTYDLGSQTKAFEDAWVERLQLVNSGTTAYGGISDTVAMPSGVSVDLYMGAQGNGKSSGVTTASDGTANATATGAYRIETGNKTSGTGDSGSIIAQPGTSSGGQPGQIHLNGGLRLGYGTYNSTSTITADENLIDALGTITLTLPPVSGLSGKTITIKHTGTSLSDVITIDGDGSETIDGASDYKLHLFKESVTLYCTGTLWRVHSHYIPSEWTSYTPTGTYSGEANATYAGHWKRIGDSMILRAEIDFTGTVAALGVMTIDLPSNTTIDTAKLSGNFTTTANFPEMGTGGGFESGVAAHQLKLVYSDTNTLGLYSGTVSTSVRNDDLVDHNSPAVWGTSDAITVMSYSLPITDWEA